MIMKIDFKSNFLLFQPYNQSIINNQYTYIIQMNFKPVFCTRAPAKFQWFIEIIPHPPSIAKTIYKLWILA